MARHGIRANKRKPDPEATIQAPRTFYEKTHPAGSAERFLDQAAKEALVAAAAGGIPTPRQFVPGAVRAMAKEAERKYPDPLLEEAASLPAEELARRAAHAEAYRKAMEAQNEVVRAASTALSPAGNMVANQAGAVAHDALTRQDWDGGNNTDNKGGRPKFVRNGNLRTEGRKRHLFRDVDGKVTGYGTQRSVVAQDDDGTWVAIPTIVDGGAPLSEDEAFKHYKETGEFFHRGATREEAEAGAAAAHEESQAQDAAWWNNYIADHLDDGTLGPELRKLKEDEDFVRWANGEVRDGDPFRREVRQDWGGGKNSVASASAPLKDVREAAIRRLPEREQQKIREADRKARLREERRRLDNERTAQIEAEARQWLRRQLFESGAIAEARLLRSLNPAKVVADTAPFLAPSMFAAHLSKLRKVADVAKSIGVAADHPGWARLAKASQLTELGRNAAMVNAAMSLAPQARKAVEDLREKGIDILDDPDAAFNIAMLGMLAKAPARQALAAEGMLKKAGTTWENAPRELKLQIKNDTGVERFNGEWVRETVPLESPALDYWDPKRPIPFIAAEDLINPIPLANAGIEPSELTVSVYPDGTPSNYWPGPSELKVNGAYFSARTVQGQDLPPHATVRSDVPGMSPLELLTHETIHHQAKKYDWWKNIAAQDAPLYANYFGDPQEQAAVNAQYRDFHMMASERANTLYEDTLNQAIDRYIRQSGLTDRYPAYAEYVAAGKTVGIDPLPRLTRPDDPIAGARHNLTRLAAGGAPRVIEVPALRLPHSMWKELKDSDPGDVLNQLSHNLQAAYARDSRPVPFLSGRHAVIHNPQYAASQYDALFGADMDSAAALATRLYKKGVYDLNSYIPPDESGDALRRLYREEGYLPVSSVYARGRYRKKDGTVGYQPWTIKSHFVDATMVRPDGKGGIEDLRILPPPGSAVMDLVHPEARGSKGGEFVLQVPQGYENVVVQPVLHGSRSTTEVGGPVSGGGVINGAQHMRLYHQDAKGGETPGAETVVSETPVSEAPVQQGGPRIVINPTTFHNKKDALCVAFNEGFRVWMEANDFQPQSEPTERQRRFFSDTAYTDDEVQLRRTILARIATFDTSVKDPTDDQLSETASFLGAILESDWCKNEWERDSVSRLMNAVQSAVGAEPVEPRQEPLEPAEAEPLQRHAAMGGGETEDEKETASDEDQRKAAAIQFAEERGMDTDGMEDMDVQTAESVYKMHEEENGVSGEPEAGNDEPGGDAEPADGKAPEGEAQADGKAPEGEAQADGKAEQATPDEAQAGGWTGGAKDGKTSAQRIGAESGVWTGGEPGKGRQLTAAEAEWQRNRLLSGGSMRASDARNIASQTGVALDDKGRVVGQGSGAGAVQAVLPEAQAASADAGLDRQDRGGPRRLGEPMSRSLNGPALKPKRPIGAPVVKSLVNERFTT